MEKSVEAARDEARTAVEAADSASAGESPGGRFSKPSTKLSLAVAIVAAILLLTILLPTGAPGPKYTDVHEITAAPRAYDGKTVAVVGGVQQGSVSVGAGVYAFNLTDYADESVWMRVVAGEMVATFGEGKKVLAEGHIDVENGVPKLVATKISIGCPTDYRGATPPQ